MPGLGEHPERQPQPRGVIGDRSAPLDRLPVHGVFDPAVVLTDALHQAGRGDDPGFGFQQLIFDR